MRSNARVLIYSHDSFGLGHLRRCRTIAHALVDQYKNLSVLIITGSPIISSFDFKARVDFVRVPGVIKLHNGEYTSLGLHIDLTETLAMRESILRHTAETFNPDVFIVDKEPPGLMGEVIPTLQAMKKTSCQTILGLRDVMDDSERLKSEWKRKDVMPLLENLYDEIWVYGPAVMGSPLQGLQVPECVQEKMRFTGFIPRDVPSHAHLPENIKFDRPSILVTTGGGGDGEQLVELILSTYEDCSDRLQNIPIIIVLGPFMSSELRVDFTNRADNLPLIQIIEFSSQIEKLMEKAKAIIGMGGYNTFCEILSFDKPALLLPRFEPRMEQLERAQKAQALGLIKMIDPKNVPTSGEMVAALQNLMVMDSPSFHCDLDEILSGIESIGRFIKPYIPEATPNLERSEEDDFEV